MAIRAAVSRAMSAVAAGERPNFILTPHAVFADFIEMHGVTPQLTMGVDDQAYPIDPLHTLVISRAESRRKNKLYEAVKAHVFNAARIIRPNRISGEELSLEIDGMKHISTFFLSVKEPKSAPKFAWHEVQAGFTEDESLHSVCSTLNPDLWREISGCSSYQSLVFPIETFADSIPDAPLRKAVRERMEETLAEIAGGYPMSKSRLHENASVGFGELYELGVQATAESHDSTEFKWRIHDGLAKFELSFQVHQWEAVLETYLPYILGNYSKGYLPRLLKNYGHAEALM